LDEGGGLGIRGLAMLLVSSMCGYLYKCVIE
jgi:hypothetical protein